MLNSKLLRPDRIGYPFAAVAGQAAAKHALLLLAIEPELRGALIAVESGSAKSVLARAFASIFSKSESAFVKASQSGQIDAQMIELPLGVTEDRLLGGLDLERTLATGKRQVSHGLLAQADGRVLYVDSINLLDADAAVHLANAIDSRRVFVERESVSATHSADFVLVATFNRAEGEPSSLLRDRVGLIVESAGDSSPDERAEIIERDLRFEKDRSGFVEEFAFETAQIKYSIETGRTRLPRVRVSKERRLQIAQIAMRLGVEGNRADLFALKAARANAALAGRAAVGEEDVVVAIQLVLAPRARTLPLAADAVERQAESSESEKEKHDQSEDHDSADSSSAGLEEVIIAAIDARTPPGLLGAEQQRSRASRAGKRFKGLKSDRGRYIRSDPRRTRDARVAIDATLRAAAPFQRRRMLADSRIGLSDKEMGNGCVRRDGEKEPLICADGVSLICADQRTEGGANQRFLPPGKVARVKLNPYQEMEAPAATRGGHRVKVQPSDLRYKKFKHRSGIMFIFAVDASGSMALNRMAQAKGALTRLLGEAYLHRDKVALISFRGEGSQVLLAPTRSVELAKRLVDAMPAGGGTPISAGLMKAIELARLSRLQGMSQAVLVLFTDGRANVRLREERAIEDELKQLGALLRAEGIASVILDTKARFLSNGEGVALARNLGARYVYLARASSETVHKVVSEVAIDSRSLVFGNRRW